MYRRPHDVIHIVGVVLEGVQRLVVLEERKRGDLCKCLWLRWCEEALRRERECVRDYIRWHTRDRKKRKRERRNGEREWASFRQSGAASALGPVWVQSLIKKPRTFTQHHKTAGWDERQGPSTRCTVTSAQQLCEGHRDGDGRKQRGGQWTERK